MAAGILLTACGGTPPPAAPPASTTSAAPVSSVQSPAPPKLTQDIRDAFQVAMAAHPGADLDLDKCTRSTLLTDNACGAAITAASQVATDTALLLRARDPTILPRLDELEDDMLAHCARAGRPGPGGPGSADSSELLVTPLLVRTLPG